MTSIDTFGGDRSMFCRINLIAVVSKLCLAVAVSSTARAEPSDAVESNVEARVSELQRRCLEGSGLDLWTPPFRMLPPTLDGWMACGSLQLIPNLTKRSDFDERALLAAMWSRLQYPEPGESAALAGFTTWLTGFGLGAGEHEAARSFLMLSGIAIPKDSLREALGQRFIPFRIGLSKPEFIYDIVQYVEQYLNGSTKSEIWRPYAAAYVMVSLLDHHPDAHSVVKPVLERMALAWRESPPDEAADAAGWRSLALGIAEIQLAGADRERAMAGLASLKAAVGLVRSPANWYACHMMLLELALDVRGLAEAETTCESAIDEDALGGRALHASDLLHSTTASWPVPPRALMAKWSDRAFSAGQHKAGFRLGIGYWTGLGVSQMDQTRASLYHAVAAQAGSEASSIAFARRQFEGLGMPANRRQATSDLENLLEGGGSREKELRVADSLPTPALRAAARKQANEAPTSVSRDTALAQFYLNGRGNQYRPKDARKLLERAAAKGDMAARAMLAQVLEVGRGGPRDVATATSLLKSALGQTSYILGYEANTPERTLLERAGLAATLSPATPSERPEVALRSASSAAYALARAGQSGEAARTLLRYLRGAGFQALPEDLKQWQRSQISKVFEDVCLTWGTDKLVVADLKSLAALGVRSAGRVAAELAGEAASPEADVGDPRALNRLMWKAVDGRLSVVPPLPLLRQMAELWHDANGTEQYNVALLLGRWAPDVLPLTTHHWEFSARELRQVARTATSSLQIERDLPEMLLSASDKGSAAATALLHTRLLQVPGWRGVDITPLSLLEDSPSTNAATDFRLGLHRELGIGRPRDLAGAVAAYMSASYGRDSENYKISDETDFDRIDGEVWPRQPALAAALARVRLAALLGFDAQARGKRRRAWLAELGAGLSEQGRELVAVEAARLLRPGRTAKGSAQNTAFEKTRASVRSAIASKGAERDELLSGRKWELAAQVGEQLAEYHMALGQTTDAMTEKQESMLLRDAQAAELADDGIGNYFVLVDSACRWGQGATWAQGHGENAVAMAWGMRMVEQLERAREQLERLDPALQECFAEFHASRYRQAADLAWQLGQYQLFEDILSLQKRFEHDAAVRGTASARSRPGSALPRTRLEAEHEEAVRSAERNRRSAGEGPENAKTAREDRERQRRALASVRATPTAGVERTPDMRRMSAIAEGLRGLAAVVVFQRSTAGNNYLVTVQVPGRRPDTFVTPGSAREIDDQVRTLLDRQADYAKIKQLRESRPEQWVLEKALWLYNALGMGRIESIARQAAATTLMIQPDAVLKLLPFATLHDGNAYLIRRFAVTYFSLAEDGATLVNGGAANRAPAPLRVSALGVSDAVAGLPALPHVKHELTAVVREPGETTGIVDGRRYLNAEATPARWFESLTASSFNGIYVASHFVAARATQRAEPSGLVFGDGTSQSLDQLTEWLRHRQLPSRDLAVFSACDTAKPSAGDGIWLTDKQTALTLADWAGKAGFRSVVATLWRVEDRSTSNLMAAFQRELATGRLTKAEALRRAQLTMIDGRWPDGTEVDSNWRHAYYWAGFALFGDPR